MDYKVMPKRTTVLPRRAALGAALLPGALCLYETACLFRPAGLVSSLTF